MKIGIIGCGLIGKKRAANAVGHQVAAVADIDLTRAKELAGGYPGCLAVADWKKVVAISEIEAVVVATTHDLLSPIGLACLKAGKHVLLEKPAARSRKELLPLAKLAKQKKRVIKVGFNHRFHPAVQKAKEILETGGCGPLLFIRANYGHGGRIGYDREWRAQKKVAGGGEMIDQGMHLIDLARYFMGDFHEVYGYVPTYFWDMKVEDNSFLHLKTRKGQTAWLHASWTEWKNMFSLEIYSRTAKLHMTGLGGSYGQEQLVHYQMLPEMGPPQKTVYDFPGQDLSWELEFKDFVLAIETGRRACGDIEDGLAALAVTDAVYKMAGKKGIAAKL